MGEMHGWEQADVGSKYLIEEGRSFHEKILLVVVMLAAFGSMGPI